MDIVLITTIIASLFLIIGLAEPLAARLRLPYTVILAALGTMIGAGAIFFLHTTLTDALNPVAEAILALPIRSNVLTRIRRLVLESSTTRNFTEPPPRPTYVSSRSRRTTLRFFGWHG